LVGGAKNKNIKAGLAHSKIKSSGSPQRAAAYIFSVDGVSVLSFY